MQLCKLFETVKPASDELIQKTEAKLCQYARAYLALWWSLEGRCGETIESAREEQQACRDLCAGFHFLLQRRLSRVHGWPRWAWFDGFFPSSLDVTARDALAISGMFLWVEGQDRWWLEPGHAAVQPNTQGISTYIIKFGDADRGLRTKPYGGRRAEVWAEPPSWVFTFEGNLYASMP